MTHIKPTTRKASGPIAVVVAQYNPEITHALQEATVATLKEAGYQDIVIVDVPGAFELPVITQELAEVGQFEGMVVLGCVIRGETSHYDVVVNECARGIQEIATSMGMAIGFGVLTTENREQAIARAGGLKGNKGVEAAEAMLATLSVIEQIGDRYGFESEG